MIKFIRINPFRTISILKQIQFYRFSKQSSNSAETQNQNYLKSRQPVIKVDQPQKQQNLIPKILTNDRNVRWGLLLANFCFSGLIYIYPLANIGIATLNSGFIMSQLGQEFKKFLIKVNNNHFEELSQYRSLQSYSKIVLQNMLILSVQSLCLASNEFYLAHTLTILWYLVSIHKKIIPKSYYPVILTILLAIATSLIKQANEKAPVEQQNIMSQKNC